MSTTTMEKSFSLPTPTVTPLHDNKGQRISTTDQANHTKQFTYDALGRLSAVTDALGQITTYGYDELGNKISQTDANGRTTKFAYNIVSKLVSKQLPAGQTMSMTYNADNTLASQTDYNTNQTFFDYDTVGNLLDKKDSTGRSLIVYVYNPDGSQSTATRYTYTTGNTPATTFTTTNTYDAYGRLQSVANPNGTLQYTYDAVGNKLSVVDPGKSLTTTYAYDADDRLQQVTHPGGAVTTYTYDKVGNRQSVIRPNHVTTTYTYDHLNRLTDVVNANAATNAVVSSYHYTLDADGKRLSVTDSTSATTTYGYDADDRNSSSAYSYNANGDVLNDGTHTYSYDFEDHLTGSGTQSTQTATYAYDADGNRIQKIDGTGTVNYLVDSNRPYAEVLEERDGSGNVLARYDYGDDLIRMDRGSLTRYYLFDGLGSTRQLTDGTGAVTDTYAYDAFGNLTAQTGSTMNPYLFNGQEQDAGTGLYYLRARYMNPQDGRFISQDPYGGDNEDPISLHRYLYAGANPVNNVDPGGEDFELIGTLQAIAIDIGTQGFITAGVVGEASAFVGAGLFNQTGGNPLIGALVGFELGTSLAIAQFTDRGPAALGAAVVSAVVQGSVDFVLGVFDHKIPGPDSTEYFNKLYQHMFEAAASGAASVAFGSFGHQSVITRALIASDLAALQDILDDANGFFQAKDKSQLFLDDLAQVILDADVAFVVTAVTSESLDGVKKPEEKLIVRLLRTKSKKLVDDVEILIEATIEGAVGISVSGGVGDTVFDRLKEAASKGL